MKKIECNHCKKDTEKRIVIKHKPLKKIDVELPDGYEEWYCTNIIKKKKGINTIWIEEECRNRLLVKKVLIK